MVRGGSQIECEGCAWSRTGRKLQGPKWEINDGWSWIGDRLQPARGWFWAEGKEMNSESALGLTPAAYRAQVALGIERGVAATKPLPMNTEC